MLAKIKTNIISFRVNDGEYELLKDAAQERGLTESLTARSVVLETLSGYDRKQEMFLRRLDAIDEVLNLILTMSAIGAAAGSLPLDAEHQDVAELREKLKIHFQHSGDLGRNLVAMLENGKL